MMYSPDQFLTKLMKMIPFREIYWRPKLVCPECRSIPLYPVTSECGHTWCRDCRLSGVKCGCGAPAPLSNGVEDILVRDIINMFFENQRIAAQDHRQAQVMMKLEDYEGAERLCTTGLARDPRNIQLRLIRAQVYYHTRRYNLAKQELNFLMSVDPRLCEAYFWMGILYKEKRQYENALKHFYVSWLTGKSLVRDQIIEVIQKLFRTFNKKNYNRFFNKMTRNIRAMMRICNESNQESVIPPAEASISELMCVLCTYVIERPLVTPCGHTFCRECIERCLDHNLKCPLCKGQMETLRRGEVISDSVFISVLVAQIPMELQCRPESDPEMMALMVCTTAFPTVSCPILISEGRYRFLVRRCIRSGTRQFGMVSCRPSVGEPDQPRFSQFGTLLEIKDCITRKDGSMILSTVGVSRFRIIHCDINDGYDVAKVEMLQDTIPMGNYDELDQLSVTVREKAEFWYRHLVCCARNDIEHSFGPMPDVELDCDDGPAWVWWLLAAMPLTVQLKRMLLGTEQLILRLRVIDKTLDLRRWSLREPLRHHEVYESMEPEEDEPETVIQPPVERWLLSPGSLRGDIEFGI